MFVIHSYELEKPHKKEGDRKMVLNTEEKDLLKTFKEILPKMGGKSKAYLLGYGEGYKKKAEESEKEGEKKGGKGKWRSTRLKHS